MTPLEVVAGRPLGTDTVPDPPPGSPQAPAVDPWRAIEDVLIPALARPPLVVSFSGGRDSSLLLACAMSAARRAGLPEPIAVTMRYPGAADTTEDRWQELVVSHLRVSSWEKVVLDDQMDLLGPICTTGMLRHGLPYPGNAHSIVPVARAANGGTVVIGLGGDELFAAWHWRHRRAALDHPLSITPRHLGTVALGVMPPSVRKEHFRRRAMADLRPWLTSTGVRSVAGSLADEKNQPLRWDRFVRWTAKRRSSTVGLRTIGRLARDEGTEMLAPLLETSVVEAIAVAGGRRGWSTRTAAMDYIIEDRLPAELVERRSKAEFSQAFWGPAVRTFARSWDGTGVDPDLIDIEQLRATWLSDRPKFSTILLLHQAWLSAGQSSSQSPPVRRLT